MPVYSFVRHSVGHFFVGASSTVAYGSEADVWSPTLQNGMKSTAGKFIDSAPDVTSTISNIVIPQVSDFQNLFDQYRFKRVTIKLIPLFAPAEEGGPSAGTGSASIFYCTTDQNDIAVDSTLVTLLARESVKCKRLGAVGTGNDISISFVPKAILNSDSAGTATADVTLQENPWLATSAGAAATHSGVRVWLDDGKGGAGTDQLVIMFITWEMEFRAAN